MSSVATASESLAKLGIPAGLAAGAISGLACFLAFPPADLWVIAPFALIPLAMSFSLAGRGTAAAAGAGFGVVFNALLLYWIRLFGWAPYIALTIVQTLWIVLALQLGVSVRKRLPQEAAFLAFPLVFLLQEFARSHVPWGGFSWGGMGYTQHDNLVALRLAAYTGVWGLSFLVVLVNSLLAETLVNHRRNPRRWAVTAAVIALVAVFPIVLPVASPDGPKAQIAMVQGNVPGDAVHPNDDDQEVLENLVRLTDGLETEDLDLVVWPEGAFDRDPFRQPEFRQELLGTVRRTGVPFMVGAILGSGPTGDLRNTSLMLDQQGRVTGIYTKQNLVPFGEWVPLRGFLQPLVSSLDQIPYDQNSGDESTVFNIRQGSFASLICYESTYAGLVRSFVREGARLLVVSANFSSFEDSAASAQHIAFSQLRAAEQRMWLAHTSISGISAVVDPQGRVLESSGLFEPAVLTPTVQFATSITPYARLGDWVPALAALSVLGLLLGPLFRRRRQD